MGVLSDSHPIERPIPSGTAPTLGEEELADALAQLDSLPTSRFERLSAPDDEEPPIVRSPYATRENGHDSALLPLFRHAELRLGRTLGERFTLRSILGTGACGAVYGAVDRQTGRPVAVKVLHEGLQRSQEHVARFGREATAAQVVGHDNVVDVLDAGSESDGTLYIVMEWLDGQSMFYAIEEASLSPEGILQVGIELLSALSAAHTHGIVHRDVKPENIFLCRHPSGGHQVKLLDFGIAKFLGGAAGSFSTADGLVLGTPHYMSPEMCSGEPAAPAADLWAVGAVLFHAFADAPPFSDEHLGRLLLKIIREPAPGLGTIRESLPSPLCTTIDRALLPDVRQRWQTADEFGAALAEVFAQMDFPTV